MNWRVWVLLTRSAGFGAIVVGSLIHSTLVLAIGCGVVIGCTLAEVENWSGR